MTDLEYYRIAHEALCKAVAEVCAPDDLAAIFSRSADFTAVALADFRLDPADEALDQAEDVARSAADRIRDCLDGDSHEPVFADDEDDDDPDPAHDPKEFVRRYLEQNPGREPECK